MKRTTLNALAGVIFISLFVAVAALPAQDIFDPAWSEVAKDVRPVVEAAMKDSLVTGLSIVVVDGNRTVWSEGFGYADAAAEKRADADTIFEIGSISKTFTGLMVMQLVEQGKIDLDRPISDYIPAFKMGPTARDFPRNDRPITVRDMMAHHSGIPGDLLHGAFAAAQDPSFNDRLLAWLAQDSATYPPGYRWSYSNTAVSLLEDVIEAASGRDFVEYSQEFLSSLGMAPASFFKTDPALLARLSKAYDDGEEVPTTYINVPASGSIAASANQMSLYLRMLIGRGSLDARRIVRPETLAAMLTKQYPDNPLDVGLDMGLSFILSDADLAYSGPLFWHNGATLAFRSHLEVLADQKLGVFVVSNSTSGGGAVEKIAKAALVSALKHKRGIAKPETPAPAALERIALPKPMLENFAGIYVADDRNCYEKFAPSEGGLAWHTGPAGESGELKNNGTLSLWSDGLFRISADSRFGFEFKEAGGRFILVVHAGLAKVVFGERYAPKPVPSAWKARLGTWVAVDPDPNDLGVVMGEIPECSLRESDGLLVLTTSESIFIMEPISDGVAAVRGLGRFGGTSMRVVAGADGKETLRFMLITYGR
jgi:CubicO group peptidase (beta-lactamase class C family)